MASQCGNIRERRELEHSKSNDGRIFHAPADDGHVADSDIRRLQRIRAVELGLSLLPDDRAGAGLHLYFDGTMSGIEARQRRFLRAE
jgi:hypothetical protein